MSCSGSSASGARDFVQSFWVFGLYPIVLSILKRAIFTIVRHLRLTGLLNASLVCIVTMAQHAKANTVPPALFEINRALPTVLYYSRVWGCCHKFQKLQVADYIGGGSAGAADEFQLKEPVPAHADSFIEGCDDKDVKEEEPMSDL